MPGARSFKDASPTLTHRFEIRRQDGCPQLEDAKREGCLQVQDTSPALNKREKRWPQFQDTSPTLSRKKAATVPGYVTNAKWKNAATVPGYVTNAK